MTKDDEVSTDHKLNGCGWIAVFTIGLIVLAFAAVALFILFNIGAWIGGQ